MKSSSDSYIHSVYLATEGEGIHVGSPQVFVRYQGCAIGCINCDSMETWSFTDGGKNYSVEGLLALVESVDLGGVKRVSITGGDPLHKKHIPGVLSLLDTLKSKGYFVNIEASGVKIVDEIFEKLDFISFDLKTPSTGVKANLSIFKNLIEKYHNKIQIKAVVADREDFDAFVNLYESVKSLDNASTVPFVITPCYEPTNSFDGLMFQKIMEWNYAIGGVFKVIGQQHKWVFGTKSLEV